MIMKKLFLFCAAMLTALAVNAEVVNINPGTNTLQQALEDAATGDVIVMAGGTYVENNGGGFLDFDSKNVIVKAAEGAHPIIDLKVPITISGGARAEIIGVKIDATNLQVDATWYEHVIYATDATAGNKLILDGCEIYNHNYHKYSSGVDQGLQGNSSIYCASSNKLDSCIIKNCYFHDITKSCLFFENTDMLGLRISNSTFANIAQGSTSSYYAAVVDVRTVAADVIVDHCTFYDCQAMSSDYGAIGCRNGGTPITNAIISNCIFALPAINNSIRAVYTGGGQVNNCLTFNYGNDSGHEGIHSGPTRSGCMFKQDPLFVNAAGGDLTLGTGSLALSAGTDGSNLGDPYWWPRTIYLYNALNWTAPHVNLYKGPYWDNSLGSGNIAGSSVVKANVAMTQEGSSKYWKADYSGNRYPVASFTSVAQPNYDKFHGCAAIYRADFDANAEQNMFIPNTTSNETKNGVNYFSNGIWVPYTGNTYTVTYEDLNYKTLCLPFGGTLTGANAYTVTEVNEITGTVTLSEPTTTLTAGVAYIIKPTALTVSVAFAGEPVTVGTLDYLRGNLNAADWKVDNSWWAYILLDNEFCMISSAATANVPQFKAILKSNNSYLAPSLRIVESATSVKNLEGENAPVKFIKNGQLYIQKDGVTYDMTGRAVK